MERWLRILRTAAGAPERGKLGVTDTSVLDLRVGLFQADFTRASDAAMVSMTELGRIDLMIRTGFLSEAFRRRWRMPLGTIMARFKRPVRRFQRLRLQSRVIYWDDRWVYFEHRFLVDGHIAAVALAKGAVQDGERRIPPGRVLEVMGLDVDAPERPDLLDELDHGETLLLWDAEADHGGAWTPTS